MSVVRDASGECGIVRSECCERMSGDVRGECWIVRTECCEDDWGCEW